MDKEISIFLTWAEAQGCEMADLKVQGRTFHAGVSLAAGTTVFKVPFSVLMNLDAACNDKVFGELYKKLSADGASERIVLTLFVAVEKAKGETSFWFPYLDSLPSSFSSPLWLKDDELALLRGTKVAASLSKDRAGFRQIVKFWAPNLLSTPVTSTSDISNAFRTKVLRAATEESALLWARTVVLSRGFTLLLEGRHKVSLVPLFDLLDHSPSARVEWITNDAEREIEFISASEVQAGEELYNNYGQKANDELLQGYGFCLYPNPADVYHIRIGLSAQQPKAVECEEAHRSRARQELMWRMGVSAEFALRVDSPLPEALIDTARICLLSDSDVYSAIGVGWNVTAETACLEISATDFKAISNLRRLLITSVKQFDGGLDVEIDKSLLFPGDESTGSGLKGNARFAVMYRLGQKEIIHTTLRALGDHAASTLEKWIGLAEPLFLEVAQEVNSEPLGVNLSVYQTWLARSGLSFSDVSEVLSSAGHQPYLQLRKQCGAGYAMVTVPPLLLLAAVAVQSDSQKPPNPATEVLNNVTSLDESTLLKLKLLFELGRGTDSVWAPYINHLANHVKAPVYYEHEMLELLEGTNLLEELNNRLQQLHEEHEMVLELLQDEHRQYFTSQVFTFERWLWADTVVEKCALRVRLECQDLPSKESRTVLVLAPLVSSLPSVLNGTVVECLVESQSGSLVMRALCSMKTGTLLQILPTGKDNETRIFQFGADSAVLDNEHDFVEICLGSEAEDPFIELKEKLLEASGLSSVQYLRINPSPAIALAAVALHSLGSQEEFEEIGAYQFLELLSKAKGEAARAEDSWCAPTGEDVGSYEHLNKYRNEAKAAHDAAAAAALQFIKDLQSSSRTRRAASTLRRLLQNILVGTPGGSASKDRQLYLKSTEESGKYRPEHYRTLCALLAYRQGQKQILEAWISHLKEVIKLVPRKEKDVAKRKR